MLSNAQALELIKQFPACFVVWATDKNAIVAVHPLPSVATAEERQTALAGMISDHVGPTKARFFESSTVTLETLEREQADTGRIEKRVAIFRSWSDSSVETLVSILESETFEWPMDAFHGCSYIIEEIYSYRSGELTSDMLNRLQKIADERSARTKEGSNWKKLQFFLSVLRHDNARFLKLWDLYMEKAADFSLWSEAATAAGDLRVTDGGVISQILGVLLNSLMFGPRFEAMIALGKIGPPASLRAAEAIRKTIYDSSPSVAEIRKRVIDRITEPEEAWRKCPKCVRGKRQGKSNESPNARHCKDCLGLAVVHT